MYFSTCQIPNMFCTFLYQHHGFYRQTGALLPKTKDCEAEPHCSGAGPRLATRFSIGAAPTSLCRPPPPPPPPPPLTPPLPVLFLLIPRRATGQAGASLEDLRQRRRRAAIVIAIVIVVAAVVGAGRRVL